MSAAALAALAPLAVLGAAAVAAMLATPVSPARGTRWLAGAGLALAATLWAARIGAPPVPATPLLVMDGVARFGGLYAAAAGLAALSLAPPREGPALLVLAVAGAAMLAAARHGAALLLGAELASLAVVGLAALGGRMALEAAFKAFVLLGMATALVLFGIVLLWAASGSLALADWPGEGLAGRLGLALLAAGLAVKLGLVPFHGWVPDLFEGAPPAAALISGAAVKGAAVLLLLRLDGMVQDPLWTGALIALGAVSIVAAMALAAVQARLSRMLGWSSVAHAGFAVALVGAGGSTFAVALYLAGYAAGLAACLAVMAATGGHDRIGDLAGLAGRKPGAAVALTLGLLALAGLPVTGGFWGKVYLFATLADAAAWIALMAAAAGTAAGVWVYGRFLVAVFTGTGADTGPVARAVLVGSTGITLVLGLAPALLRILVPAP